MVGPKVDFQFRSEHGATNWFSSAHARSVNRKWLDNVIVVIRTEQLDTWCVFVRLALSPPILTHTCKRTRTHTRRDTRRQTDTITTACGGFIRLPPTPRLPDPSASHVSSGLRPAVNDEQGRSTTISNKTRMENVPEVNARRSPYLSPWTRPLSCSRWPKTRCPHREHVMPRGWKPEYSDIGATKTRLWSGYWTIGMRAVRYKCWINIFRSISVISVSDARDRHNDVTTWLAHVSETLPVCFDLRKVIACII